MTVQLNDIMGLLIAVFCLSAVSLVVNFIYFNTLFDRQTDIMKKINKIRRRYK